MFFSELKFAILFSKVPFFITHTHTHTHTSLGHQYYLNFMSQVYIYFYKMQDFNFSIIVEQLEILKFDNVCDFRFMFLFCFKS